MELETVLEARLLALLDSDLVQALVFFNNTNPATTDIAFCNLVYTSAVTSTNGLKACITYANSGAGVQTTSVSNSLLICEGAIAPLGGGPILCVQNSSSATVNFSYGQIIAGINANRLPTSGFNKIPYVTVS